MTARQPDLIPIPPGAASTVCSCGVTFWWARYKGKGVPVSCPETLETKTMGVLKLATRKPTPTTSGVGILHHIDCANRKTFGSGAAAVERAATRALGARPVPETADDVAARIRAAETCAEQYGVRCTGAPQLRETCDGFAVICFVLDGKLFAAPCSAHADPVHRALKLDRRSDHTVHSLHEYLVDKGDAVAKRFAARCVLIREWNAGRGFTVPAKGAT